MYAIGYDLRYPSFNETQIEPCLTLSQYDCVDGEVNRFDKATCVTKHCPLECDSVKFKLRNSIGSYLSKPYVMGSPKLTSLVVFLPNLKYTHVSESPQTTFVTLLSQLGGSLGMFISFSMFTLFEAVEVFVLLLHAFISNKNNKKILRTTANSQISPVFVVNRPRSAPDQVRKSSTIPDRLVRLRSEIL